MEPDTFILTAHGAFSATVLSCLNELYQNGVLCDVTLMAQNLMEFPAHKVVLVSSSGYFKTLLDQGYLLGDDRQITTGMPASQLKILLDFMYTGTLQLTESNLGLIQKAAEQLKIEEAVRLCKEYTETQEKIRKEANALKDTPRSRGRPKKKAANDTPAEVKDFPKTPGRKPSKKGQEKLKGGKSTKASPPETSNEKLESNRKSIESKRTEDDTDDDDDSDVDDSDKEWEPKGVKIPESKLTRKQKCSCHICKRQFEYHSLLYRHLHQDHRISSTDVADKLKKQSILTHFLSIKKELGTSNMCMTCNRTFKTWSSASLHIKRKHLKHVHRVCRLCFKECSTLTHLRRHQLVKHNFTPFSGDKMLLKCRLCPRVFLYKKSRKSHEFTKHGAMGKDIEKLGGEQPSLRWRRRLRRVSKFKCGACFRRYTTENRLRIHMIKFHGVKSEQRGSHKCMFCELEFPLPKLLNMHVSDCHNCACEEGENGVVLCMICKQMFLRRGDLKRHLHDIHNLNQPIRKNNLQLRSFRCDVQGCTFSTDSTPTLKIHVETVHPEVVFNCEYLGCTYKSCLKMDVRRHYTLRHERGMGVVCTLCGKKYRKRYHLRIHMFNKHEVRGDGLRTFKCPEEGCEYETTASNSLKLHATKHKKDKPFNCPYCGRCVKTEKTLQKHINKRHLNIRPYLCQVCGASYGEEHELKTHEARHLTDKPYICEHCSYSTVSKADLASHVLARHNQRLDSKIKVYQCHICGYTTTRKKHHERHIKGHLNIRDMVCNICGKTFAHDRTLAKHIRWVHTEKKVKCPHCDHVTADNYHLKEHIRVMHTHRDLKPFKCGYCDFRCKISGNVRKHCLHKHKGVEVKYLKVARTDVVKEVPKRPLLSDVSMRTADVFSSALEMLATQTVQAVSSELSHLSNQVVSGQQQIASVSDQPHIESCSPVPMYAGNQILSVQHVTLGQHVQQQHQEPQHQQHQQPSSIATSQVMTSHMTGSGQLPVSAIRTALMQPVTNQMPPPHPHQHPNLLPPHGHLAGPIDMSTGQIPHWTMGQF